MQFMHLYMYGKNSWSVIEIDSVTVRIAEP